MTSQWVFTFTETKDSKQAVHYSQILTPVVELFPVPTRTSQAMSQSIKCWCHTFFNEVIYTIMQNCKSTEPRKKIINWRQMSGYLSSFMALILIVWLLLFEICTWSVPLMNSLVVHTRIHIAFGGLRIQSRL